MGLWIQHAVGIKSKIRQRDGKRIFFVEIRWKGKRYIEKAGTTQRQAVKRLGRRQTEVDNGTFVPAKIRKQLERIQRVERVTFEDRPGAPGFRFRAQKPAGDSAQRLDMLMRSR